MAPGSSGGATTQLPVRSSRKIRPPHQKGAHSQWASRKPTKRTPAPAPAPLPNQFPQAQKPQRYEWGSFTSRLRSPFTSRLKTPALRLRSPFTSLSPNPGNPPQQKRETPRTKVEKTKFVSRFRWDSHASHKIISRHQRLARKCVWCVLGVFVCAPAIICIPFGSLALSEI